MRAAFMEEHAICGSACELCKLGLGKIFAVSPIFSWGIACDAFEDAEEVLHGMEACLEGDFLRF